MSGEQREPLEPLETIARILVNGYNKRVKEWGPADSFAGEAVGVGEHLGFVVTRGGEQFAVHVRPLRKTP